jgi:predicted ATP-grasp superfamily ATP-dependent carboligase
MPPPAVFCHPNDGCLTAARALVRRGVEVHLLTTPEYRYVLASRGVHGRVMPDIRTHTQEWLDELNGIGAAAVLCGSDAASEWVTAHRDSLLPTLRTFESADRVHVDLMDKQILYRTANEAGVRAPWMVHVATADELAMHLATVTFPCVVKPTMGHVAKQMLGIGTTAVASRAELAAATAPLLAHEIPFLLTELVPGPETALEGSVAVRAADGEYALEYGRHKVRQWPLDYGVGSLLESADVPETLKMNRQLLDHTGYVGISACETKRHSGTGELYLIEINVRVPASFGLAEAAGTDGAWRLYAALTGLPLGRQPEPVEGRKVMLPQKDLQAAAARIRRRETTPLAVLRSWRGVRDTAAWSWRDPAPALAQVRTIIADRRTRKAP